MVIRFHDDVMMSAIPFFAHSRTRLDTVAGFSAMAWCLDHKRYPQNIKKNPYICHGPKYQNPKKCHASFNSNILRIARKFWVRFCWVHFSWPVLFRFAAHRRLDTKSISACTKSSARDEESDELKRKIIDSKPPWLWLPKCQCFRGEQNPTFCRFSSKKKEETRHGRVLGERKTSRKTLLRLWGPDSPCFLQLSAQEFVHQECQKTTLCLKGFSLFWKISESCLCVFLCLFCLILLVVFGNPPKTLSKKTTQKQQQKKKRQKNSSNSLSFPKVAPKAPKRSLRRSATLPAAPSSGFHTIFAGTKPMDAWGEFLSHLGGSSWWKSPHLKKPMTALCAHEV